MALDAIPFDQLSAEEKVNAQVFRAMTVPSHSVYKPHPSPYPENDVSRWSESGGAAIASGRDRYLCPIDSPPSLLSNVSRERGSSR